MIRVCAFLLTCSLWITLPVAAQLEGRFYLDKEKFIAGEPVYVHYTVSNTGKTAVEILSAQRFCAGFAFKVSLGSPFPAHPSDGCYGRPVAGSCGIGHSPLAPGESKTEDILLNDEHNLESPGTYYVTSTRDLPYGTADDVMLSKQELKTTTDFKILIEKGNEAKLEAILQPYVTDLDSKDDHRNSQAHLVVSSTGPTFLEDRVLDMLKSESSRGFAVTTLRHMNTPRSRKALAELVSKGGEWRDPAIQYLGEMGDSTYYPLLLKATSESTPGSNSRQTAIRGAARLGHDQFIPFLIGLLQSNEKWNRINAVQGMYESGSRKAVPIVIDLLRDDDDFIARMATGVLVTLTHRTPVPNGPYEKDPRAQYELWRDWWFAHGKTAPIYGPNDCGEIESLR